MRLAHCSRRVVVFLAVVAGCLPARVQAQQPPLSDVLLRAGDYVTTFSRDLSGVVAEERYVQDVSLPPKPSFRGGQMTEMVDNASVHRETRSDVLLVRPEGTDRYIQFRDTYQVDGAAIRDRNERLLKLFTEPSPSSLAQAARIMGESSRYNIGSVGRNINVPVLPMTFLEPANQRRFTFTGKLAPADGVLKASSGAHFSSSTEVWVVQYRETAPHTLIHTTEGRDLFSKGRFWIEASSGRVLMTELIAEDPFVQATITVTYESPKTVGLLVPTQMIESYRDRQTGQMIEAVATYANFRRFSVSTEEKVDLPEPPDIPAEAAAQMPPPATEPPAADVSPAPSPEPAQSPAER